MRTTLVTLAILVLPALACAAGGVPPAPAGATTPATAAGAAGDTRARILAIDMQRAVLETRDGLRAQAELKATFEARQHELDVKQADLVRERDDIDRQAGALPKEALAKRREEWQRRMTEIQASYVAYSQELKKQESALTAPILRRMMAVVSAIGREEGCDVVLDVQAAPYVRPGIDVTDRAVVAYDRGT